MSAGCLAGVGEARYASAVSRKRLSKENTATVVATGAARVTAIASITRAIMAANLPFNPMRRTILIIGGTRNLGPDLVAALLVRGDEVTVLNRGVTPDELPRTVRRLTADRSDAAALAAALRGHAWDAVVDTTLYTGPDAAAIARVLAGRVGRYLCWSSGQVYLVRAGLTPPFRESDYAGPVMAEPPVSSPDHAQWRYGVDKRAAEDALMAAHSGAGFPVVVLRMPMITSARDHYGRLAAYVHRVLDGGPLLVPDDQSRLSLRHVCGDDVVAATVRALEPGVPAGTALNISQDETLTLEAMLDLVAGALGVAPPRLVQVPRATLAAADLLPACSPWSGRWMSVLDTALGTQLLGLACTGPARYLPPLVAAAREWPTARVPGWDRRAEELAVAAG